jgi:hypothetical protein
MMVTKPNGSNLKKMEERMMEASMVEKMVTKSDLKKMEERMKYKLATKSDFENMEEKMEEKLDLNNIATKLKAKINECIEILQSEFGVRLPHEITSAWMARHISETKNIRLNSDTFKSVSIKAPKGDFLFVNKNGKRVDNIELDCYSVEPVHAVVEFTAIMKPPDTDTLLEKVDLFVRKVKYLKDKEAREAFPLASFALLSWIMIWWTRSWTFWRRLMASWRPTLTRGIRTS